MVLSFSNPVTKVDTENTTYHCFLLRKHLHTCSSAKNKFTDKIYFTNGKKVIFFQDQFVPFYLIHTKFCQKSTFLSLNAFPFLEKRFLRFSVVSLNDDKKYKYHKFIVFIFKYYKQCKIKRVTSCLFIAIGSKNS